jgi:hypothetical protein
MAGGPCSISAGIFTKLSRSVSLAGFGECNFLEREVLQMISPREYRRRARHLLQMAQTCQDSQIAARLRVIAADYFDAGQGGGEAFQQQQQVQPDTDAE